MAKVREGVVLSGLSGRTGNAVFVNTPNGTVLRDRPLINDPNTALQRQVRDHMGKASQAWKAMSLDQAGAWRRYAEIEAGLSTGARVLPNLVFNRLALKFLQMHPGAAIPVEPPATNFPGDAVRFSIGFGVSGLGSRGSICRSGAGSAEFRVQSSEFRGGGLPNSSPETGRGRERVENVPHAVNPSPAPPKLGRGGKGRSPLPTPGPSPRKQGEGRLEGNDSPLTPLAGENDSPLAPLTGEGGIEVVADRDNAPGVVTEVLLQPLESVHRRTYLSRYRTAGFFAFEAGVPVFIPTEARVCAVAVRFVCAATGQAGALMELGVVGV